MKRAADQKAAFFVLERSGVEPLRHGVHLDTLRETGNWKLETGNWKWETGNWKLEIGNWKLETGNWK